MKNARNYLQFVRKLLYLQSDYKRFKVFWK